MKAYIELLGSVMFCISLFLHNSLYVLFYLKFFIHNFVYYGPFLHGFLYNFFYTDIFLYLTVLKKKVTWDCAMCMPPAFFLKLV